MQPRNTFRIFISAAIAVIEIDEVLVVNSVCGGQTSASCAKSAFLTSRRSDAASMTSPQLPAREYRSPGSGVSMCVHRFQQSVFPASRVNLAARVSRRLRGSALQQKCHTVKPVSMTGSNFSNACPHGAAPNHCHSLHIYHHAISP